MSRYMGNELMTWSQIMREVFSTRLPEDAYIGVNKFMDAFGADTTVENIQNALVINVL